MGKPLSWVTLLSPHRWGPSEKRALAYGMTNFSAAVLHNVFITYYVELALTVSHVTEGWFMAAQMLYCVWNSINDPACGWWADTHDVQGQRRIPRIRRGGPLWALSFALMWFPWADGRQSPVLAGLHLILCLALYDGWLSYTLVNHQALLADMTADNAERELCNMAGAACQVAGSFAIFFAQLFWDADRLGSFQRFAVLAAVLSCVGFYVTVTSPHLTETPAAKKPLQRSGAAAPTDAEAPSLRNFVWQTFRHRNYIVFTVMSLLQQFSCTFNTNFFSLFLTCLVGKQLSPTAMAAVVYTGFIAPHLGTIMLTPVLGAIGKKRVIQGLFVGRFAAAILTALAAASLLRLSTFSVLFRGSSSVLDPAMEASVLTLSLPTSTSASGAAPTEVHSGVASSSGALAPAGGVGWLTAVLVAGLWLNRVLTENVCRLQPLVITDLVDEDTVMHRRGRSMSSMMFGSVALFTKPGQSLAPMFGAYVLSRQSGGVVQMWLAVLQMVTIVPIVLAALEALVWARFALDGPRLRLVKARLRAQIQLAGDLPVYSDLV